MSSRAILIPLLICACTSSKEPAHNVGPHAESQIGPAGGKLELDDFRLEIPPGALSSNLMITIDVATDSPDFDKPPVSPVYRLGPAGTTFAVPVTVSMPHTDTEENVAIWWTDETDQFVPVFTTIKDGRASAQSMHFSWIAKFKTVVADVSTSVYDALIASCKASCVANSLEYCKFYAPGDPRKACDPDVFTCNSFYVSEAARCTAIGTCWRSTDILFRCENRGCYDTSGCVN